MKADLDVPLKHDDTLKDGFWPMIRVATSFEDEFIETIDVFEKYDKVEHLVGGA